MSDKDFHEPVIRLNRVYTRSGDDGSTNLVNGRRVPKDDPKVEAYGVIDELNALVGLAVATIRLAVVDCPELSQLEQIFLRLQNELFNLGSQLATDADEIGPQQPRILPAQIERLEREIDAMNEDLPELASFVLPGSPVLNAQLHVCRTVCRRAERCICTLARKNEEDLTVPRRYLNRLSDAFFIWGRWVCHKTGVEEVLWDPNQPS